VKGTFVLQVTTNGKLQAAEEAQLYFAQPGQIEQIRVSNGARVQSGQILAVLYNTPQRMAVQEAELQLAESRIELNDLLITQGGRRNDSTSVKPEVYAYIKLKSGYERASLAVQKARLELEKTYLRAPRLGRIANLTLSAHNPTPTDRPFCSLLNDAQWIARCPVLETELAGVQPGQLATVVAVGLPDRRYTARVVGLNPGVDKQGFVEAVLQLTQPDSRLLSGMNVRVTIERPIPNQLIIPKRALLERSGRKVVFTHENGRAKWHYVTVGFQNDTQVTLQEGLTAGEQVLVGGHLNLGHDALIQLSSPDAP
jgi:RND family efflux transporter MFP subunit